MCFKVTNLSSNAQVKRGISRIMLANRVQMYETDSMGKIKFYLLKHSQVRRYIIHLGDNPNFTKTITTEPSTIEQLIYCCYTVSVFSIRKLVIKVLARSSSTNVRFHSLFVMAILIDPCNVDEIAIFLRLEKGSEKLWDKHVFTIDFTLCKIWLVPIAMARGVTPPVKLINSCSSNFHKWGLWCDIECLNFSRLQCKNQAPAPVSLHHERLNTIKEWYLDLQQQ